MVVACEGTHANRQAGTSAIDLSEWGPRRVGMSQHRAVGAPTKAYLDQRRMELAAPVTELSHADEKVVQNARTAADGFHEAGAPAAEELAAVEAFLAEHADVP